MEYENRVYTDEWNNSHTLKKEISRGGQGVIYSTLDDEIVVKILFDGEINHYDCTQYVKKINPCARKVKFTQFKVFSTLQNLDVTFPISNLKDDLGYTMRLLNDMIPFEKAFDIMKTRELSNNWLDSLPQDMSDLFGNFSATGGVKLRLSAFFKIAINIAKLHSLGLVYCDISGNNLFITNGESTNLIDKFNVTLIDCDNIDFMENTLKNGFYSRDYGAPEVVAGKGCSFASDCYALLIAIFWEVTQNHPFKGALLEDSFDLDSDFISSNTNEMQENLNKGLLPWLLDKVDTSNAFSNNEYQTQIPYDYSLSQKMLEIFDATFSKLGRTQPTTRPTIFSIVDALYDNLNSILKCEICEMDYNYFKHKICPYCTAEPKNIVIIKGQIGEQILSFSYDKYIKKSSLTYDIFGDFSTNAFLIALDNTNKFIEITTLGAFRKVKINDQIFYGTFVTDDKIIKLEADEYKLEIEVILNDD